jgi:hypothetical protein
MYEINLYNWEHNVFPLPKKIWWELDTNAYMDKIYDKSKADETEPLIIEEKWRKYIITSANWEKKTDWTLNMNWVSWYLLIK